MEKIKDLSIRKTIVLYMALSLVISFFAAVLIYYMASATQKQIWWKYTDKEAYYQVSIPKEDRKGYTVSQVPIYSYDMSSSDAMLSQVCDFLQTWSVLILTFCGSVIAVFLFYRNKIKVPLEELKNGSRRVADNELDFSVTYVNKDEMGQLCGEFEKMRKQLVENNKKVWKMIEEEKALRSSIAHDIRAPLTILKGYQEMMLECVPSESLEKEKLLDMLQSGMNQIEHLDSFIDTMRQLSKLEDRQINYQEISLASFVCQVRESATFLTKGSGKVCIVPAPESDLRIGVDTCVVLEVLDNLICNALRYAVKEIKIFIYVQDKQLMICVLDDGTGFQETEEKATKAYYHANPQDDLNHFGLGLYISRIYCEKHGGRLLLKNRLYGGAEVRAVFGIKTF